MKPNKQSYIDYIVNELKKGNLQYNEVNVLFCTKFDLTKQSFNKYWKIANEAYGEEQQAIKNAIIDTTIELEKEAITRKILSKLDALEILTEIAKGEPKQMEGQIIIPAPNERRQAIETISKIKGWNAPVKKEIDQTLTSVQPLQFKIIGKD